MALYHLWIETPKAIKHVTINASDVNAAHEIGSMVADILCQRGIKAHHKWTPAFTLEEAIVWALTHEETKS